MVTRQLQTDPTAHGRGPVIAFVNLLSRLVEQLLRRLLLHPMGLSHQNLLI